MKNCADERSFANFPITVLFLEDSKVLQINKEHIINFNGFWKKENPFSDDDVRIIVPVLMEAEYQKSDVCERDG